MLIFLGDATGCCGHSDETLRLIRDQAWSDRLEVEGVDAIFTGPLRTGWWTVGARGLPAAERARAASAGPPGEPFAAP